MTFEKVNMNMANFHQDYAFGSLTTSCYSSSPSVFSYDLSPNMHCFQANPFGVNIFGTLNMIMGSIPDFVGDFVKNAGMLSSNTSNINFNYNNLGFNNLDWMYNGYNFANGFNFQMDTFTRTIAPLNKSVKPFAASITYKNGRIVIDGYNERKGKELAEKILHNTHYCFDVNTRKITDKTKNPQTFTSNCTRYVKRAIEDVGLGAYVEGHACDMIAVLDNNSKFKKISTSGVDVKKLPAGCILVYGKGVANYSSEHGHIEVSLGDDRAASDAITDNVRPNPTAIYVPV